MRAKPLCELLPQLYYLIISVLSSEFLLSLSLDFRRTREFEICVLFLLLWLWVIWLS